MLPMERKVRKVLYKNTKPTDDIITHIGSVINVGRVDWLIV